MICENRDPAFWQSIADHPDVAPHISFGERMDVGALVLHPKVMPIASENGGFILFQLDGFGRLYELHTMFRPEGWGREVSQSAKEMFYFVFNAIAEVITTLEVRDHWRSSPPKSYGWVQCGDWRKIADTGVEGRLWILTRDAWVNSPACKRMLRTCH